MKASRALKPALLLSSAFLLIGCGNSSSSASFSSDASLTSEESLTSQEASSAYDDSASSVKEALAKLGELRNYDVSTVATYDDGETIEYNWYFQPNYVYCDYEDFEEGYGENEGSVYRFNRYFGSFVASDAYDVKSLWGSELVRTLAIDPALVDEGKEVSLNKKKAKLQWLEFLEIDLGEYVNIVDAKITLEGDAVNTLRFEMTFDTASFVSTISHINNGGDEEVSEFVSTHKAATYPEALKYAKEDFATNNYVRVIEDYITYSEDEPKTVCGYEYYLPTYFYTFYNQASGYSIYSNGYLSLHNKALETTSGYVYFDGAYFFTLNEDCSEMASFLAAGPAFTTNTYDMPSIMNYPSLMSMWEHNFQFFEMTDDCPYDGASYKTENIEILYEFYIFSQVEQVLPEDYASRYLTALTICVDQGDSDSKADDKITFLFDIKNDGQKYRCEYKYERFGEANIEAVETFASYFVDAE